MTNSPLPFTVDSDLLNIETQHPEKVKIDTIDQYLVDFGRVAFGQIEVHTSTKSSVDIELRLGSSLTDDGDVEMEPFGYERAICLSLSINSDQERYRPRIPSQPDTREGTSDTKRRIDMPEEIGEVLPFRYVEVRYPSEKCHIDYINRRAIFHEFSDGAADFDSDNKLLNNIWELCRYTMKATSAFGVFIDGERERFPREGDSYVNQLGWYCTSGEWTIPRRTLSFQLNRPSRYIEYLLLHPICAWTDYLYTGQDRHIRDSYGDLAGMTLEDATRADGLLEVKQQFDESLLRRINRWEGLHVQNRKSGVLIDHPSGQGNWSDESDGYRVKPVNAACCAFQYRSLRCMERIADALNRSAEVTRWKTQADRLHDRFQEVFWDPDKGAYRDAEDVDHYALHATMYPLAFNLVPETQIPRALEHVVQKGMVCSVYGAQFLLDTLYKYGRGDVAFDLLTADHERSWANMLRHGATITHEAWDPTRKDNEDFTHPWGAAPANIIPRWIAGLRPATPGWDQFYFNPAPGHLNEFRARVTAPIGEIEVNATIRGSSEDYQLAVPEGSSALLDDSNWFIDGDSIKDSDLNTLPPGHWKVTRSANE